MENFTLQFFINGFFSLKSGTMKELAPWITMCKEEEMPYTIFNSQNEVVKSHT